MDCTYILINTTSKKRADLRPLNYHENLTGFGGANVRAGEIMVNENITDLFGDVVHLTVNATVQGVAGLGIVENLGAGGVGVMNADAHNVCPFRFCKYIITCDVEKVKLIMCKFDCTCYLINI